jgi:NADP-dependent 3-hydroxy acid dehydrogenase YdfG
MVTLSIVHSSNSHISSSLPEKLVAVFIGATSGIGEITLKKFAKYTLKPRVYFIGRSQEAGERIEIECKEINPAGEFRFIKADVSLIRIIDAVCERIKEKEKSINILFLSSGVITFDRSSVSFHTPYLRKRTADG